MRGESLGDFSNSMAECSSQRPISDGPELPKSLSPACSSGFVVSASCLSFRCRSSFRSRLCSSFLRPLPSFFRLRRLCSSSALSSPYKGCLRARLEPPLSWPYKGCLKARREPPMAWLARVICGRSEKRSEEDEREDESGDAGSSDKEE